MVAANIDVTTISDDGRSRLANYYPKGSDRTIVGSTSPSTVRRLRRYLKLAEAAFSERTVEGLVSDLRIFSAWCVTARCRPLPTNPSTVARFVRARGVAVGPATLSRNLASIAHIHRALDLRDPVDDNAVRLEMRILKRRRGIRPVRRRPIRRADVRRIAAALGTSLTDRRDRALLLVARDTLCRRTDLSVLDVSDVDWWGAHGGARLVIRRSKSDQEGAGRSAWLSPGTRIALRDWVRAARLESGALFRTVIRDRRVGARLRPQGVSRRFKVIARRAGLDSGLVSSHSVRIGMAVDLVLAGASLIAVQHAGGWRSPNMPSLYTQDIAPEFGAVSMFYRGQLARGASRSGTRGSARSVQ